MHFRMACGVDRTRHRRSPAATLSYAVSYAPTAVAVDLGAPTYARSPWKATGCSSRAGAASSSSAGCCRRMPTTPLLRSAARWPLYSASSDGRPSCLTTMPRLRQPGRAGRRGRNRSLRRRPGQSGPARIPDPVSGSSCRRCTPIPGARRAPLAVLRESIDGGPSLSGECRAPPSHPDGVSVPLEQNRLRCALARSVVRWRLDPGDVLDVGGSKSRVELRHALRRPL